MLDSVAALRFEASVTEKAQRLLGGLDEKSRRRVMARLNMWCRSVQRVNEPRCNAQMNLGANTQMNLGANTQMNLGANANEPAVQPENAQESFPASFLQFWSLYPRRTGKQEALRIWVKLKPDIELQEKILRAIREQKLSEQWTMENGRFIPHPKTWLNQGRWDDEPTDVLAMNQGANGYRRTRTDMSGLQAFARRGQIVDGGTEP